MTNNFPYNEDVAFEAISEAVDKIKEADPEGFLHMQQRLEELMELPPRDLRLLMDLKDAVPFDVTIPKHVRERDPELFPAEHEVVSETQFLGDMGGISVKLEPTDMTDEARVISLTMLEMPLRHPLRKRVKDYQKKRIKYLRKQRPIG
jgi:hypothetical protein